MNNGVQVSEYKGKKIGYYGTKALPFHKGHLECAIKASQMVDVLFVVIGYDDVWDKDLCENTKFNWVSSRVRERWVTETLKEFPNIRVLSHYERRSENYMEDESLVENNQLLKEKVGGRIDYCFSSEPTYEEYFNKVLPDSKHVVLDAERSTVNISATKIREEGVYKHWELLPRSVQKYYTKRVCICGVESTGKTTLAKKLAAFYNTNYIEEYGRVYYEELNGCYDIMEESDLIDIACGHNYLIEKGIEQSNKVMFVDTDNVYTQFFQIEQYNRPSDTISSLIMSGADKIDLYLYLEPTMEQELDGMREPKTIQAKNLDNAFLKRLYKDYKKRLTIFDNPNDLDKIKNAINELFDNKVTQTIK